MYIFLLAAPASRYALQLVPTHPQVVVVGGGVLQAEVSLLPGLLEPNECSSGVVLPMEGGLACLYYWST